jgi:hypothetical protein
MVTERDEAAPELVRQPNAVEETQTVVAHCTLPTTMLAVGFNGEKPIPRIVTEDEAAELGLLIKPVECESTGESKVNALM